ncbi:replicative DNA helicase [Candidatus Dojkabacteria bacterium]|uniref:Replicative DNA helicase n=1 Tax=Candidatus Dojkabacteria bacterium TaxID=2099670 RepID=A0A955I7Z5_9BACT|nr:replicative DNA helicase [Candidatus Dojkabacteria bacterium]
MEIKLPPQNLDAEKSVLGAILLDSEAIYKIAEIVTSEDFYDKTNGLIYKSCIELFSNQKAVDVLTLSSVLKKKKKLADVGGVKFLSDLVSSVPTSAHVEEYARLVKETSLRRKIISLSSNLEKMSYEEDKELSELLDQAEKALVQISETSSKSDFVHISTLLEDAYERAEELNKNPGAVRGVATGFSYLDNLLGGLQKSDLIILAARPSVGKTAFSLDIARHAAVVDKKTVAVFSLEMSSAQLMDRLLSMQVGVGLWDLRTGRIKDEFFPKISDAMGMLSETNLYIDDTPGISIMELRSKARKLKLEKGLDMVVVDYLQLIVGNNREGRVQEVSEISRYLKGIARELNVPVLALSQLSRAIEQRSDGNPMLSDLRDSGSIEQDADIVLFLSRVGGDGENSDNRTLSVAKHRNGPTGAVELFFVKEMARFKEIDRYHQQ